MYVGWCFKVLFYILYIFFSQFYTIFYQKFTLISEIYAEINFSDIWKWAWKWRVAYSTKRRVKIGEKVGSGVQLVFITFSQLPQPLPFIKKTYTVINIPDPNFLRFNKFWAGMQAKVLSNTGRTLMPAQLLKPYSFIYFFFISLRVYRPFKLRNSGKRELTSGW